jgi:hypothetical protein
MKEIEELGKYMNGINIVGKKNVAVNRNYLWCKVIKMNLLLCQDTLCFRNLID